jgi:mRNA interferase HicA
LETNAGTNWRRRDGGELRRKLAKLGCTFEQGSRHMIAIYKGKTSPIPRHPAQEIKTGTYRKILKDLGLEGE